MCGLFVRRDCCKVGVEEAAVQRWQLDTSKPSYRFIKYSAWRLFFVLAGVVAAIGMFDTYSYPAHEMLEKRKSKP